MTHTKTNVIQYNEYYPYGLQTRNSWTRDGSKNNFLHNGGTELNTSSGYYDLFYRNYDAAIGKFIQVDPQAQIDHSVSPYVYAGNNPLMFNDPLGDVKITQETPMYNPNAGWGSFALNYAAFRSSTFIAGFSYFAYVDPAFAFLQISPEAHATLYGTATTDEIYGKRWNPHGGEQITYDEWRALGGNDPRATDKDLFFSGGWEAPQGGAGDPNPFNFFVDMMKSWLNQFTADNRDELYTTNGKEQNNLRKANVIVNTLANTQVTPYYAISFSKQFGGAIPAYGSLTYSGGNFYGTVGSDLTLSGPSLGPNFSFSIGLSVGPGSSSPFSIGSSAGYMGMGFEMSGTKGQNSLSIGRPFSIGFVISNSSYWVSGNGGYTFQISGND